jgi:hypothetical protein
MFRVCKSMEEALQKRVSPSELKEIDSKIMLVRRSCTWSYHAYLSSRRTQRPLQRGSRDHEAPLTLPSSSL